MLYSCRCKDNYIVTSSLTATEAVRHSMGMSMGMSTWGSECQTYDSILATLEEIGDGSDHVKAVEAKGLYHQVATFAFIISLVLSSTKSLLDQLQSTHVDFAVKLQISYLLHSQLWKSIVMTLPGKKCMIMLRVLQNYTVLKRHSQLGPDGGHFLNVYKMV